MIRNPREQIIPVGVVHSESAVSQDRIKSELPTKGRRKFDIVSLIPTLIVHQPPRRSVRSVEQLPQPTLDNFNPEIGREKFLETNEPMYGKFSLNGYKVVLAGRNGQNNEFRKRNGELLKRRKRKRTIDANYFQTESGQRLHRRLSRNYLIKLSPHVNHNIHGDTAESHRHLSPSTLEQLVNNYSPKLIKFLAKFVSADSVAILNRKLRFNLDPLITSTELDSSQRHFHKLLLEANEFDEGLRNGILKGTGNITRLATETTAVSSEPADLLLRATLDTYDTKVQLEAQHQGALVLLGAKSYSENGNIVQNDGLVSMQAVLTDKFFEGKIGEGEVHTSYVLYDNKTNQVIGIDGIFMPHNFSQMTPDQYHWKVYTKRVRKIQDMDNVYGMWDPDTKSPKSIFEKILFRAMKTYLEKLKISIEQNIPLPPDAKAIEVNKVTDMHRMRLVVEGTTYPDDERLNESAVRFINTLLEHGDVKTIQVRTTPLTNQDGVDDLIDYLRIYVTYKNAKKPYEVIFFDEVTYLNSQYHKGKLEMTEENADKLLGRAHSLFKLFRQKILIPLVKPSVIPEYRNLEEKAIANYNAEREALTNMDRADEETSRMLTERNIFYQEQNKAENDQVVNT